MAQEKKRIGILTAGGDSPGLNAAIRGFGKAAIGNGWELLGYRDGIRGLVENRYSLLDPKALSGILTIGGTVLGTSRDKVHRMVVDGEVRDMRDQVVANYEKEGLSGLVLLGGGGTAKNAMRLAQAGLNVITLPKTIDNDIARTDTTFGFATAMEIGLPVVWVVMVSAIAGVPAAAVAGWWGWVVGLSALVWVECGVLAVNGGRCPSTDWAAAYTEERAPNFDIYLPAWLAEHNKVIFGTMFVGGELMALWCWMRRG